MKIAIVGAPERAVAWENHLSPHRSVNEIIITPEIKAIPDTDACLIINDHLNELDQALKAVRLGWHVFLIASLPTDTGQIRKLTRYAEESGSIVQLTHWPTFSQAGHWMMNQMSKPALLDITHHLTPFEFTQMDSSLRNLWIDELAFCLRWIDSGIRHLDANIVTAGDGKSARFVLFIRFNNGATASLQISNTATKNIHLRSAATTNTNMVMTCDVDDQNIRIGTASNSDNSMVFDNKQFNPARSAEVAVTHFLKALQMQKEAIYNPHHAYQLCTIVDQVDKTLRNVR